MASDSEELFGIFRAINFEVTTPLYAVTQACGLAFMYVGSLYIISSPFPRNHPLTIRKRFQAVLVVCLLAPMLVFLWSTYPDKLYNNQSFPLYVWLGIHSSNILVASVLPLILTMILFLGPLLQQFLQSDQDETYESTSISMKLFENLRNIVCWRNFVLLFGTTFAARKIVECSFVRQAPLTEEFVFRACMLPFVVPAFGIYASIFLCPLFFGIAHVHHAIEGLRLGLALKVVVIQTAFQMSYTTLFGAYSAFLFLRTGHLIGPVLCHCFCNIMGFPEFESISHSPFPKVVSAAYVIGLVMFLCLLLPITNPDYYSSIYWHTSRS